MNTESLFNQRRSVLKYAACGFGDLTFQALLARNHIAQADDASNPLAPRDPHHAPRASRVIFLNMEGGPSIWGSNSLTGKPLAPCRANLKIERSGFGLNVS